MSARERAEFRLTAGSPASPEHDAAIIRDLLSENADLRHAQLEIAGYVNGYHNDGTALTAAQTLLAIADILGRPMEPDGSLPKTGRKKR